MLLIQREVVIKKILRPMLIKVMGITIRVMERILEELHLLVGLFLRNPRFVATVGRLAIPLTHVTGFMDFHLVGERNPSMLLLIVVRMISSLAEKFSTLPLLLQNSLKVF